MDDITNELEALRSAVDDMRSFRFHDAPLAFSEMRNTLAQIERRLEALEMHAGQVKRTGDVPMWLQDAVNRGLHALDGKLTASEIAVRLEIPDDHGTLIRLGRYLQTLGVRRTKSGSARHFRFDSR